jgi:hypothetical protein
LVANSETSGRSALVARVATSSLVARVATVEDNCATRVERGLHSFNRSTKFVLNLFNSSKISDAASTLSYVRLKVDIVLPASTGLGEVSTVAKRASSS